MQLRETRTLPVPLARAWAALNDLALLQQAIPGCESLVQTGDDAFDATMALPAGPLTTRFVTHLRRTDIDAPNACGLLFDARTMGGNGSGRADMRLKAAGRAATTLDVAITVEIEGALAQLGNALVELASQHMADEFFDRFVAGLDEQQAGAPA